MLQAFLEMQHLLREVLVLLYLSCAYGFAPVCELPGCTECDSKRAYCDIADADEPVPQQLHPGIHTLNLHYSGSKPVTLEGHMLERYEFITNLTITGNIQSFANDSLSKLKSLTFLNVHGTKISTIPQQVVDLLANTPHRSQLLLPSNRLRYLPELLPATVEKLSLANNQLDLCKDGYPYIGLDTAFHKGILFLVDLTGAKLGPCREHINASFLSKFNMTRGTLQLTRTDFFHGKQDFLLPLVELTVLDISDVEPYSSCPAKAAELFTFIPRNVEQLNMMNWRSNVTQPQQCIITPSVISGLKDLTNLKELDFSWSDMAFGSHLTAELFTGFKQLEKLSLRYCQIYSFESGTFNVIEELKTLDLAGNPLGSREMWPFGKETPFHKIQELYLKNTAISSNIYHPYLPLELLATMPHLDTFDVTGNFLQSMPIFGQKLSKSMTALHIKVIYANMNYFVNLIDPTRNYTVHPCELLPELTTLALDDTQLEDLTGACSTLTHLFVNYNNLYINWDRNMEILHQLRNLQFLEIGSNHIAYLRGDLFRNMKGLWRVWLRDNDIEQLPEGLFAHNAHLNMVDLSWNGLTSIRVTDFSHMRKLKSLLLNNNKIAVVDQDMIEYVKSAIPMRFGIVNNPFDCGCQQKYFQDWVKVTTQIKRVGQLKCAFPHTGEYIYKYKDDYFTCYILYPMKIILMIVGSVLAAILIAIPVYRYWWYIRHAKTAVTQVIKQLRQMKMDDDSEYDAFLSYDCRNESDGLWVNDVLIPAIENEDGKSQGYKLYIEGRDSQLGGLIFTSRCNALEVCRKIILVLSNSYLQSNHCLCEADLAGLVKHGYDKHQPDRILVLVREELHENLVKQPISALLIGNVIDLNRKTGSDMESVWKRVRNFLKVPSYMKPRSKAKPEPRAHTRRHNEASGPDETQPLLS